MMVKKNYRKLKIIWRKNKTETTENKDNKDKAAEDNENQQEQAPGGEDRRE